MITFNSNLDCDSFIKVKIQMVTLDTVSMVNREEISDKEKKKKILTPILKVGIYEAILWGLLLIEPWKF